jgi:hypothetical protein
MQKAPSDQSSVSSGRTLQLANAGAAHAQQKLHKNDSVQEPWKSSGTGTSMGVTQSAGCRRKGRRSGGEAEEKDDDDDDDDDEAGPRAEDRYMHVYI